MEKAPIPSVAEMIRTHTLAAEMSDRHHDKDNILDDSALAMLRRFSTAPSTKDQILWDIDIVDEPGDEPGTRANHHYSSHVGYCIARHGTKNPVFNDDEVQMLRMWFESGGPDEAIATAYIDGQQETTRLLYIVGRNG
jgi:hypothetical protein